MHNILLKLCKNILLGDVKLKTVIFNSIYS